MPTTPYVVGQWVRAERFYGRVALLDEILQGPRNWVWLLGTRRIGKTSLLKQLEHETAAAPQLGYFPIFWDFQGAENLDELRRGFNDALLDAEDRLRARGIDPGELEGIDLFDALGRLRRRLRVLNLKPLLLCDEAEELIKLSKGDPALLSKLRRALQSQEGIRSVLASTIKLWALAGQREATSPFLHGFTPPLFIRGLADDEARDLIRQTHLPEKSRPPLEASVVETIRQRCDNHPYLIQMVCRRYLELKDLDEALEQVATEKMVSYFFDVDFEMLTQAERDVVRIIGENTSAESDSILGRIALDPGELSGILLNLENLGYIRRNADKRFELVNHFFRRWFKERPQSRPPGVGVPGEPGRRPTSQSTTERDPATTELFDGRYQLLAEVGRGGMGVVYRAVDTVVRETIAVKILKPELSVNADLLERFRREILLTRDLGHANILPVYHLGEAGGQRYLTMRFIDGPTLAQMIAREGALPVERVLHIGIRLASALEATHARKIIHRDIKPQNVLMDRGGEPYLTDYGLARLLDSPDITRDGVFLGTPDYASPEQANLRPSDERTDVYSLGVILYEMTTGRRPFTADSSRGVLDMHRNLPPSDPRRERPGIPPVLAEVILRCLQKEPGERFQSGGDLRKALDAVQSNRP